MRSVSKAVVIPRVAPATLGAARMAGEDYGTSDVPDWRDVAWRRHLHQTTIEGRRVNYVDLGEQGDSRPIVFVHGLIGQWQNWLENIPRFAQGRRVVALDLPGFGASQMPRDEITIASYARVVAELCDRLGLAPAVLVGNSMGGYVAADVAIEWPQVVERLMLVSAAGVSQADLAKRPLLVASRVAGLVMASTAAQLRLVARRPNLRHLALQLVARHPSRIHSDMAYEGMFSGTGRPGFDDAMRACLEFDFRYRLPQIGCPTLVVWGASDMVIPVADADRFVDLIPGSRKQIFQDTGHCPMIERPRPFNDALAQFLAHEVREGELEGELDQPTGDGGSG